MIKKYQFKLNIIKKNKTSNDECFGESSGLFKVYKSFILDNKKYNNVTSIIYHCYCENELKGTPEFKSNKEEFIKFLKNNKLEKFKKIIKNIIQKQENSYNDEITKLKEKNNTLNKTKEIIKINENNEQINKITI